MDGGSAASVPGGALLVVSHDRAFLRNLGTRIIWLHQGRLRRRDGHFSEFDDWSEGILAEEAVVLHKLDRRIASETKWSREGISARRKRNQGRLRELATLRSERAKSVSITQRTMRMETGPAEGGGQMVLEGIDLSASVPHRHPKQPPQLVSRPAVSYSLISICWSGEVTALALSGRMELANRRWSAFFWGCSNRTAGVCARVSDCCTLILTNGARPSTGQHHPDDPDWRHRRYCRGGRADQACRRLSPRFHV